MMMILTRKITQQYPTTDHTITKHSNDPLVAVLKELVATSLVYYPALLVVAAMEVMGTTMVTVHPQVTEDMVGMEEETMEAHQDMVRVGFLATDMVTSNRGQKTQDLCLEVNPRTIMGFTPRIISQVIFGY